MITKHKPALRVADVTGSDFIEFYPGYMLCFDTFDLLEKWLAYNHFTPHDNTSDWFVYHSDTTEVYMVLEDMPFVTN